MTSEAQQPRYAVGVERVYRNSDVEVTWSPGLCIHWGACVGGSERAFNPERRPWVDVDAEDAERILSIIEQCPTGALHARLLAPGLEVETAGDVQIELQQDGPLFVRGRVRIIGANGEVIREDSRVALCRCGVSQNKPFCDDSHYRIGFTS